MIEKLFIPVILGTVRQGRASEAVARYIHAKLAAHPDVETELLDIRDLDLPMTDEGEALADRNQEYVQKIIRADGYVIVSPEYNHGYPGSLKRALDMCYDEYERKAVGVVGVSSGMLGGARMIEQLVPVLRRLGLSITQTDLLFPQAPSAFKKSGKPVDPKTDKRAEAFFDELIFLARALKWGRGQQKRSGK